MGQGRADAQRRGPRCRGPARGAAQGGDGTPFEARMMRADELIEQLPAEMMVDRHIDGGQSLVHIQPGTGGYGDPLRREPSKVLDDVLDEKISLRTALEAYGVVIDAETRRIDGPATDALRASRGAHADG